MATFLQRLLLGGILGAVKCCCDTGDSEGATPLLWSLHSQEGVTSSGPGAGQLLMNTSYLWAWSACSQHHRGYPNAVCHLSVLVDVLRFDNTYSLLHTKKVGYTAEVLLPDKACEEKLQGLGSSSPPQESQDSDRL